ncbi:hypothetical protein Bca4012_068145 [Brassica carinata]
MSKSPESSTIREVCCENDGDSVLSEADKRGAVAVVASKKIDIEDTLGIPPRTWRLIGVTGTNESSLDKICSSINDERKITHQSSSDKRLYLDDDEDEGLGDDEIESFLQSRYICLFAIASVTFSFLHLMSLFVNDRNKRGRGSVGRRMDETGPYLPTEKVDQLQSSDTRERKVVLLQLGL